jgi:hypothetical protein
MQRKFDFEGVEAEKAAFAAMQRYAVASTKDNHEAMLRALAALSDDRCSYVLGHYSSEAYDVSLEMVSALRVTKKDV